MKVNSVFCTLVLFCFFYLLSCNKKESIVNSIDVKTRYFNLEKIGWKSKNIIQNIDGNIYSATEVPIQYYLLKSKGVDNLESVDSIYEKNKMERVIELEFQDEEEKDIFNSKKTNFSQEEFIKYLSFDIQKDLCIVKQDKDTIVCSGVLFERTYKITPYSKVMLFFSGVAPTDKIQLIFKDRLFQKGTIKFDFKENYTPIAL